MREFEVNDIDDIIVILVAAKQAYGGHEVYIAYADGKYFVAVEEYPEQKKAPAIQ